MAMNENKSTPALDPTGSKVERDGPGIGRTKASRTRVAKVVILIGVVVTCALLAGYAVAYFFLEMTTWHVLGDIVGCILTLVIFGLAYRSVRREKLDAAGYWIFGAVIVSYGVSEALWMGETIYNAISGALLIFLLGHIVLPRKWPRWLAAAGVYLIYILLINLWAPDFRYDPASEAQWWIYIDLGITGLLSSAAISRIIRAAAIGSIRVRLLVAFVLIALLPVVAVSAVYAVVGMQSAQTQARTQLESIVSLKESEIDTWVETLQAELATMLSSQYGRDDAALLVQRSLPAQERAASYFRLRGHFLSAVTGGRRFEELFLLDREGKVILSTEPTREGLNQEEEQYFLIGLEQPYMTKLQYFTVFDQVATVFSRPVVDTRGEPVGVLAGRASLNVLRDIILSPIGLGETGDVYMLDLDGVMITQSYRGAAAGTIVASQAKQAVRPVYATGSGLYDDYRVVPVVGAYRYVPRLDVGLVAEQEQAEAFGDVYGTMELSVGVAVGFIALAVGISLLVSHTIATPLADLAQTAEQIAAGDLTRTAKVRQADEIGALARAFNNMTAQVRNLIVTLEERVTQRTRELEQHSIYLEASAEVVRAASSILDADQLVQQVVELIRRRLDLYYVGLFLAEESGEWAELRAGTGEAGQMMLARGHRIRVGEGMIGWSVANAQARVALEAGEDAVRLATTDLPETRSEAALPLRSRGRVIGALSVQSTHPDAFDQDTVVVFQTMADQLAVALDNAQLFAQTQAALESARRAYGELSSQAWSELLRASPDITYRSNAYGVTTAASGVRLPEVERALQEGQVVRGSDLVAEDTDAPAGTPDGRLRLAVPIKVRETVIGVLDTYKPAEAGEWTDAETELLETLTEQLGDALESARLYQDAQRLAAREQLTADITDRMRRAAGVEGIVQAAVDELFSVLGTSRAFVRLGGLPAEQAAEQDAAQDDEEK